MFGYGSWSQIPGRKQSTKNITAREQYNTYKDDGLKAHLDRFFGVQQGNKAEGNGNRLRGLRKLSSSIKLRVKRSKLFKESKRDKEE